MFHKDLEIGKWRTQIIFEEEINSVWRNTEFKHAAVECRTRVQEEKENGAR